MIIKLIVHTLLAVSIVVPVLVFMEALADRPNLGLVVLASFLVFSGLAPVYSSFKEPLPETEVISISEEDKGYLLETIKYQRVEEIVIGSETKIKGSKLYITVEDFNALQVETKGISKDN